MCIVGVSELTNTGLMQLSRIDYMRLHPCFEHALAEKKSVHCPLLLCVEVHLKAFEKGLSDTVEGNELLERVSPL